MIFVARYGVFDKLLAISGRVSAITEKIDKM
jgi:hypothetical protein